MLQNLRRLSILSALLIMVTALIGCGGGGGSNSMGITSMMGGGNTVQLRVSARVKDLGGGGGNSTTTVTVTLSDGQTQSQDLQNTNTFTFSNVPSGLLSVVVTVSDSTGTIATGIGSVNVLPGAVATVTVTPTPVGGGGTVAGPHVFFEGVDGSNNSQLIRQDGIPNPTGLATLTPPANNTGPIEANSAFDTVIQQGLDGGSILQWTNASGAGPLTTITENAVTASFANDLIQIAGTRVAGTFNDGTHLSFQAVDTTNGGGVASFFDNVNTAFGEQIRFDGAVNLGIAGIHPLVFVLDSNGLFSTYNTDLANDVNGSQSIGALGSPQGQTAGFNLIAMDEDAANDVLYVLGQNSSNLSQFGVFIETVQNPSAQPSFTFTEAAVDFTINPGLAKICVDTPPGSTTAANLVFFSGGAFGPVSLPNPQSLSNDQTANLQTIPVPAVLTTLADVSVSDTDVSGPVARPHH